MSVHNMLDNEEVKLTGILSLYYNEINPKYAIEITKLAKVIAPWIFTNNHQLTFGLTLDSLQTPTVQALSLILAILLHHLG